MKNKDYVNNELAEMIYETLSNDNPLKRKDFFADKFREITLEARAKHMQKIYDEFPGDADSKAAALAKIYGVGEEIKLHLGQGAYRSNGNIVSLVEKLMEDKEKNALALREQNGLEAIIVKEIPKSNISKSTVVYALAKELGSRVAAIPKKVSSGIAKYTKYAAYGALPGKYQEKIAKNNKEDASLYSHSNFSVELCGSIGAIFYACASNDTFFGVSGMISLFWQMGRRWVQSENRYNASGSPFLTIPYHLVRTPYLAVKSISKGFKELYQQKKQELESKTLESEIGDLPQLPPSESYQISIDNNELTVIDSNGNNMFEKALAEKVKQ